jgi:hypothetical protein
MTRIKALANIKYRGKRYPPGSIFALEKADENLELGELVEVIEIGEEKAISSNKERGDNSDEPISQRSRKAPKNKGGDGD